MLDSIIQYVCIDPEWVGKEYLKRCKAGLWKKENTLEALKYWNLERILEVEAESFGHAKHNALTMDQLISETEDALASISVGQKVITIDD